MKTQVGRIGCSFGLVLLFTTSAGSGLPDERVAEHACGLPGLPFKQEFTCPLCATKFSFTGVASAYYRYVRLDTKPIGSALAPWPEPICPQCGFIVSLADDKTKAEELKKYRAVIESDEYKKLPAKTPSHVRMALIFERLNKPPEQIAYMYLQAAWQLEDKEKADRPMLEKSLEWYEKYLAARPNSDDKWQAAEILKGELLRRLGRFDEAKKQFDRLADAKEFKEKRFPALIAQERALIAAKDARPHLFWPEEEQERPGNDKPGPPPEFAPKVKPGPKS